jgi:hypothetical protein
LKKYAHLRKKAIQLRLKGHSLPVICEMLNKSKTTVYYWIKDIDVEVKRTKSAIRACSVAGGAAVKKKYKLLRDTAYQQGLDMYGDLIKENTFRDFIVVYMTEGYRKCRNSVSVCNSSMPIMKLSLAWIRKLCNQDRTIFYRIHMHMDQSEKVLIDYWSKSLSINKKNIKITMKSNSGKLAHRNFASKYGVLTVLVKDTYLRSKLAAWMDMVELDWK